MPTNLALDDDLIAEACRVGKHRTKREAVNAALREYIQHRRQMEILKLFGNVDYEAGYNHKQERKRRGT